MQAARAHTYNVWLRQPQGTTLLHGLEPAPSLRFDLARMDASEAWGPIGDALGLSLAGNAESLCRLSFFPTCRFA